MTDELTRFHFHEIPVRGHWIRLSNVWTQALSHKEYPTNVQLMLGEMLAITAMVSNNIKYNGAVSIQSAGKGPIHFSFAECRQETKLRAIAQLNPSEDISLRANMNFREMIGNSKLAISLLPEQGIPYQGLVEMYAPDLAQNMERYFEKSEQLDTRILLAADKSSITGCLWQRLPSAEGATDLTLDEDQDAWDSVSALVSTISKSELSELSPEQLLVRLFPERSIFLDAPKALEYKCTCSTQRTSQALRTMSSDEINEILKTDKAVQVSCEFCGKTYEFDEHDISKLKKGEPWVH
ncbi:MAG TPA: hypothetical protein DCR03_10795 [Gammaproteobacteria bacterium]|nr:hypothetical protein [Gammaproteobacteria bacterium]